MKTLDEYLAEYILRWGAKTYNASTRENEDEAPSVTNAKRKFWSALAKLGRGDISIALKAELERRRKSDD